MTYRSVSLRRCEKNTYGVEILKNIPILTYHKISNEREFGLTTVSPQKFSRQIAMLEKLGYQSITFKDIQKKDPLPAKPVIITFDDAYESVYIHALPVLKKYGFRAVVYVITGYIGKYNTWEPASFQRKYRHLSLEQLKHLQTYGFELASHGTSHRFLPGLDTTEIYKEMTDSKKYLETITREEIISFCYPYGRSTARVRKIAEESGYCYAAQNISWINNNNNNRLALERRSVYSSDSDQSYLSKVEKCRQLTLSRMTELIIQNGALASIALSFLQKKNNAQTAPGTRNSIPNIKD